MFSWWDELKIFQQILYYIAVPATIVMVLQTALTFLGLGNDADVDGGDVDLDFDGDTDIDFDGEADFDVDGEFEVDGDFDISFQMFTVRNFIAFFTFFGWGGLWGYSLVESEWIAILIGFGLGLIAMATSAGFFFLMQKMTQSGNLVITNAVGVKGEVYLTIPAERKGVGKVTAVVQSALRELDAVTDAEEPLKTGVQIKIVGVINQNTVVVKEL